MKKKTGTKMIIPAVLLLIAILLACLAVLRVHKFKARADYYRNLALEEKQWIMENQLPDGCIAHTNLADGLSEQIIYPYFSAFAVRGLLAGTVSQEQAEAAERWLSWYLENINTAEEDKNNGDGTIYDYKLELKDGEFSLESQEDYDSADSYAAVFLIALQEYTEKFGPEFLNQNFSDVQRVIDAMLRCIADNGLSIAKEDYKMQYLMDNSELHRALYAAENILKAHGAPEESIEEILRIREKHSRAFDKYFWNQDENRYETAIYKKEAESFKGWDHFYPYAVAQLFPFCFNVENQDGERAADIYERFCDEWKWEELEHLKKGENFYWGVLAYNAAVRKDEGRLNIYLNNYREAVGTNGRAYPLFTGDAGWVAMGCGYMEDYYRNIDIQKFFSVKF